MRALMLGATGVIGRRVAGELLRSKEVDEVVLTGRNEAALVSLAELFGGGERVAIAVCDIADTSSLAALARGADVVVSAAGPANKTELPSVRACIEANRPYLSLNDDHDVALDVLELHDDAANADVTVVPGAGVSPGITDLLAVSAASQIGSVEEIAITLSVSSADENGEASAEHVLAALARPAPYISENRVVERVAGRSGKLVYFPEPVGWIETFRLGHPEIFMLKRIYPELPALEFRVGMAERAVMDVLRASARSGLASTEPRRRMLLSVASPLRGVLESLPPRSGPWTALRIDVWGVNAGRREEISLGIVDHLVNLTCLPLALAAIEVGKGRAVRPGVHSLAEVVDVDVFLTSLDARGIRAAQLEPLAV